MKLVFMHLGLVPKRFFFTALIGVVLSACAKDSDILNAASAEEVTETKEFPAVALVAMPENGGICTGTFISNRAVLTAAHCTAQTGTYSVYSAFGRFRTSEFRKLGPGIVDDPNDIAVLVFDSEVADPRLGRVIALGSEPREKDDIRIVGYGCNDLDSKRGAGTKRTGTNKLYKISDYLELRTTPTQAMRNSHAGRTILGSANQAGSCFGDSGGPMLQTQDGNLRVTGVTHAGGWAGSLVVSQYINLNRSENRSFLHDVDSAYDLHLFDGCWASSDPSACGSVGASFSLFGFLKAMALSIWHWFVL